YFRGELDDSAAWLERALAAAEARQYWWVLSQALNTKSLILKARGRMEEGVALLMHALRIAEEHNIADAMSRAFFNLANELLVDDRSEEALEYDIRNLELARLLGKQNDERTAQIHLVLNYVSLGRWEETDRLLEEIPLTDDAEQPAAEVIIHSAAMVMLFATGRLEELE